MRQLTRTGCIRSSPSYDQLLQSVQGHCAYSCSAKLTLQLDEEDASATKGLLTAILGEWELPGTSLTLQNLVP